jgi:hypothetical protein
MGWFRRSAGRHSYGVPVVASPAAVSAAPAAPAMPPVPESTRPAAPPAFEHVPRLPDDRTSQQIGGKVAEVLWGYYGQQGGSGSPLAAPYAPGGVAQAYDDAYADTLLAAPDVPTLAPLTLVERVAVAPALPLPIPVAPPVLPAEPPVLPAAPPVVTAPAPAVSRYQVFQRFRAAVPVPPPELPITVQQEPPVAVVAPRPPVAIVAPKVASAPILRPYVVQLGFMDGTTMDLAGDEPAAKALRAAALALTLREQSSR